MQFGSLHKKLSPSIPIGSVISHHGNQISPKRNAEENIEITSIETAWLNVPVGMKEESWNFNDSIGFLPQKLLCLHRWKVWWMIPRLIHDPRQEGVIPAETTLVLGKISENQYLLLIPAVDQNMVFSLEGSVSLNSHTNLSSTSPPVLVLHGFDNSHGPFKHNTHNNSDTANTNNNNMRKSLLIATGSEPFELIRVAVNIMKQHVRESNKHTVSVANGDDDDNIISPKDILSANVAVSDTTIGNKVDTLLEPALTGTASAAPIGIINNSKILPNNPPHHHRHRQLVRGAGPSFVDYFGWCTWDSFYTDLSSSRVLKGLESFTRLGVTPRFVILDDGWQSTDVDDKMNGEQWSGRLRSFHANYKFHPQFKHIDDDNVNENSMTVSESTTTTTASGTTTSTVTKTTTVFEREGVTTSLKDIIDTAKSAHHIKYFLVWHSLLGYWAGVEPHTVTAGGEDNNDRSINNNSSNNDISAASSISGSSNSTNAVDASTTVSNAMSVGNMFHSKLTYANYSATMLRMTDPKALFTEPASTIGVGLIDRKRAAAFYNAYHAVLREMGVDGVKVDAQSILPSLTDERGGGWELTITFHDGLQNSINNHFGGGYTYASSGSSSNGSNGSSSNNNNNNKSGSSINRKTAGVEKTIAVNEVSIVDGSVSQVELKASVQESLLISPPPIELVTETFHVETTTASIKHGSSNLVSNDSKNSDNNTLLREHPIIHCMCHSRETLWSIAALYPNIHELVDNEDNINDNDEEKAEEKERRYRTNLQQPVFRGSDDFWPKDPASHGPHLFSNLLNSLLLNHVGLQDWDAFQSMLPNRDAAKLHAVGRAISGGPVYTSDRKNMHEKDIITRLAFKEGRVPRCLRGALPVERLLFHDPQRTVGVPLMLQNKNPAGGYVIAAFNILGAVLEEDLNMFRFLSVEEIDWRGRDSSIGNNNSDNSNGGEKNDNIAVAEETDASSSCFTAVNVIDDDYDELSTSHITTTTKDRPINFPRQRYTTQPTPVYENNDYIDKTFIRHYATLNDVSEWKKQKQYAQQKQQQKSSIRSSKRRDYLARRFSDGALFYLPDTTTTATSSAATTNAESSTPSRAHHRIPFTLPHVFDFEIITFSPIHHFSSPSSLPLNDTTTSTGVSASTTVSSGDQWVSVTGATHMYNSGGSVIDIQILPLSLSHPSIDIPPATTMSSTDTTDTTVNDNSTTVLRLHVLGSGIYSLITTQPIATVLSCRPHYSAYSSEEHITTDHTASTTKSACQVLSIQPVPIQYFPTSSSNDNGSSASSNTQDSSTTTATTVVPPLSYEIKLQVSLLENGKKEDDNISDGEMEGIIIELSLLSTLLE